MPEVICGIDPGKRGAICVLDFYDDSHEVINLPYEDGKVYTREIYELMYHLGVSKVFIEKPFLLPQQGLKSAATIMTNYGRILGSVELVFNHLGSEGFEGFELIEITPSSWMNSVIPEREKGKTKEASIKFASTMYPQLSLMRSERSKKPCDGRADAICIAEYGRRYLEKS